jgi:chromosome partitioning protein
MSATAFPYLVQAADLARETGVSVQKLSARIEPEEWLQRPGGRAGVHPAAARRLMQASGKRFPFRVIAFANLKGGIGKTTSALALATRAASLGYRTCVVDLDPQASATLALGVETAENDAIFLDLWSKPAEHLPAALYEIQPGLMLLPSSLENSLLDSSLANPTQQKNAVRETATALRELDVDLVVIDCAPSLGAGTISALSAAHHLVIPLGADAFSFKGLSLTLAELSAIADTFNLSMPKRSVLLTRYDQRETLSRQALERLQREYRNMLAPRPVRTSSLFGKVLEERQTVFAGFRQHPAREDYEAVIRSWLE